MKNRNVVLVEDLEKLVESALLIEIGRGVSKKFSQVKKKKLSINSLQIYSGVFYFHAKDPESLSYTDNKPNFFVTYNSIPQELLGENLIGNLERKYSLTPEIENSVLDCDDEKLLWHIRNNNDSDLGQTFGRLCELIVFNDISEFDFGEVLLNPYVMIQNQFYKFGCEIDAIISGKQTLYSKFTDYIKNKKHLEVKI